MAGNNSDNSSEISTGGNNASEISVDFSGIFDSHAHYDDEAFDDDREEIIEELKRSGIDYVVDVGASMESTKKALALAAKHDFMYAAVGVHPSETEPLNEEFIHFMKEQALSNEKVVAIGEIGLDYYWPEPEHDIQKKWFIRQLDLACEVKKPVIIHSREAAKDTADILLSNTKGVHSSDTAGILCSSDYRNLPGVIHCYSYSVEMARDYLNRDFYLGIGGVVTYKNAKKLVETVEYAPLDRILLETDCPYLSPVPNRGKRNSSLNLKYVIEKLSQLKGVSEEEVIRITRENAKKLFGIK